MYTTVVDEEDFAIKPMNCPGGILVYESEPRSYRDLPIRMGELGLVHRHEKSGQLHGLMRVRCFTQDDAHIFMTPEQIKDEIKGVVKPVSYTHLLQAYGQRDPLVEYKMTGYNMFGEMTNMIAETTIRTLFNVRVEQKVEREEVAKVTGTNKDDTSVRAPKKREDKKVYPNDPCPCGSGKKYKQCCGRKPV